MVKLSIIIVNYNTQNLLVSCLDSIYANKLQDFEIIVVDNASEDDSVSFLRKNYPKVKLSVNTRNCGFSAANNLAIKQASGEYILFLNPDTVIPKQTLFKMVDFMKNNNRVGVSTCKVEMPNGEIDDACHRGFPTPWNAFCHFSGLAQLFSESQLFNGYHLGYRKMDHVHEIDSCAGAFMIVRRKVGDSVSWLDEDYFWYGEDLDFCYRVKKKGWKIMYVPDVKITHHKGAASGIKKQSRHITLASRKTRVHATKARFEAMRIFYKKHYKIKYPLFIYSLVMVAVKIKEKLALLKYSK